MIPKRAQFPFILLIAALVAGVDQFSKFWFLKEFAMGESRRIMSFLYFTLVDNTGAAFGLFQGNNRLLLMVSYVILGIFLYSARGLCERGGTWAFWGIALILGGAIGNLIDRHHYGRVIDFIDLRVWPVFNIADSAITVGAISAAIGLLGRSQAPSR